MIEPIKAVCVYRTESIEFYAVKIFCKQEYEKNDVFSCTNFYNINDAINFINSKLDKDNSTKIELTNLDKMFNIMLKYEIKNDDNRSSNYRIIWQLSKEEIIIYRGEN